MMKQLWIVLSRDLQSLVAIQRWRVWIAHSNDYYAVVVVDSSQQRIDAMADVDLKLNCCILLLLLRCCCCLKIPSLILHHYPHVQFESSLIFLNWKHRHCHCCCHCRCYCYCRCHCQQQHHRRHYCLRLLLPHNDCLPRQTLSFAASKLEGRCTSCIADLDICGRMCRRGNSIQGRIPCSFVGLLNFVTSSSTLFTGVSRRVESIRPGHLNKKIKPQSLRRKSRFAKTTNKITRGK